MATGIVAVVLSTPAAVLVTIPAVLKPDKVMVPELVRPVRLPSVPVMVELPVTVAPPLETVKPVRPPNVPEMVEFPVIEAPPLATVKALAVVIAPVLSTLSLNVPLFWKFKKSAAEPAPAAGAFKPK